jgi:hypothetical protein
MRTIILDDEESKLLNALEANEWQSKPLSPADIVHFQKNAKHTKLQNHIPTDSTPHTPSPSIAHTSSTVHTHLS